MRGRLNLFQRTMLRWRELYPYSAVHVVRVERRLDADALVIAIEKQLRAWGLRGLSLDPSRRRYEYDGVAAPVEFAVVPGGGDPDLSLEREIESQLNRAFPAGPAIDPFRFFAVADGTAFHLGLAYDHFVAGGESAIRLLGAIVARYANPAALAEGVAPNRYPPTYRALFARDPLLFIRMLAQLPSLVELTRRSHRPRYRDATDVSNGFARFRLKRSEFDRLRAIGRSWGVTLNDLLMALLLRCVEPYAAGRLGEPRRREICIGSIVNIRAEFPPSAANAFGQFLAALRVTHPVPPGATLESLARDVRAATADIKENRWYLRSIVVLALGAMCWPFLSPARRQRFYGKHHPAWGAVTSLNVDAHWGGGGVPPRDYLRGVSTGPLVPLLLAVSTADGMLSVGVSYHRGAFTAEIADRIEAEFRACVGAHSSVGVASCVGVGS